MALSSSTVEFPIPDFELLLFDFDKDCIGDNATDSVHGNAVVNLDIVAEMSPKAAWKDPVDQLFEKMEVDGTNMDDFDECDVDTSAPSKFVPPQHVVGSEDTIADNASLVTSVDDQPRTASLPAYTDPSEEEPTTQVMQAAGIDSPVPSKAPANTSSKLLGAHPNSGAAGAAKRTSRQLSLVQHFERPNGEGLSLDFLKAALKKTKSLPLIDKEKTIFPLLSEFILLPPGSQLFVEREQAMIDLRAHRKGFSELLSKSKLTAIMPEVIALLLFLKLKMASKYIGKSFFTLIASCLIGKGKYFRHAGDNIASQYRTLKAVYEALIETKPRKPRTTKTP